MTTSTYTTETEFNASKDFAGYAKVTMNSTDVYNYMKRIARKASNETEINIDCLAEAILTSYGLDTEIDKRDLKQIAIRPGYMTDLTFRFMECEVLTHMSFIPMSEAHVD